MRRLWKAATKDYGMQVPSGSTIRGWLFWVVAVAVLIPVGVVVLVDGSVLAGCVIIAFAVVLVAHTFTDLTY